MALPDDSPEARASKLVNIVSVLDVSEYEHILEMITAEQDGMFIGCSLSSLCKDDRLFGAMLALSNNLANVKWIDTDKVASWLGFYYKHRLIIIAEDAAHPEGLRIGEQHYRINRDFILAPDHEACATL